MLVSNFGNLLKQYFRNNRSEYEITNKDVPKTY